MKALVCKFALFVAVLSFTAAPLENAEAQVDPRLKAFGAMAVYGTVGGALLGTASLAFGTDGRSPALGASLGLYAGILFGTYVVASHYYQNRQMRNPNPQENYYPDADSPYEDDFGGGGPFQGQTYHMWEASNDVTSDLGKSKRSRPGNIDFYVPVLNFQF